MTHQENLAPHNDEDHKLSDYRITVAFSVHNFYDRLNAYDDPSKVQWTVNFVTNDGFADTEATEVRVHKCTPEDFATFY